MPKHIFLYYFAYTPRVRKSVRYVVQIQPIISIFWNPNTMTQWQRIVFTSIYVFIVVSIRVKRDYFDCITQAIQNISSRDMCTV